MLMKVRPFKAFRFNPDVVGDVSSCIAPPYDVISPADQDRLYGKSEYNIVRITKGKTAPSDNDADNQYTRAAQYLNRWIEQGVLKQDSTDAIYAYIQDFDVAGERYRRNSFIALAELEEFGKNVRPHEQTLDAPKIDRLHLKRATVAKFGLVFMFYEDPQNTIDAIINQAAIRQPLVDFTDEHDVRHRLFAVSDTDSIETVATLMADKTCIIADGHHRYETALNYYKETGNPTAAYQMTAFVNACHDGLVVLATHRLVNNLSDFSFEDFLTALKRDFELTKFPFTDGGETKRAAKQKMLTQMKAKLTADSNAFGIYAGGAAFYTAVLKNKERMDSAVADMSRAYRSLDVSVLHKLILERLLGIAEKQLADGTHIEYVKDTDTATDESIDKVDSGQKQIAFFMNPPKISQIRAVAEAGEKMPQKSTYFYPKMYTGLTINKL